MNWEIDLAGNAMDVGEIAELASAFNCVVASSADGRPCLSGTRFDALTHPSDVQDEAARVLALLNGIARLDRPDHRPVRLGAGVSRRDADGRRHMIVVVQPGALSIRGSPVRVTGTRPDRSAEHDSPTDRRIEHATRIAADPRLTEIIEALAGVVSWQRLRVAFEKINALVGSGDNALVKHGYATQEELKRFKANVEDPRHSGLDAVHGVPRGPLKSAKMSEQDGLAFVTRLLKAYLAR